jgi:hypothetical protein
LAAIEAARFGSRGATYFHGFAAAGLIDGPPQPGTNSRMAGTCGAAVMPRAALVGLVAGHGRRWPCPYRHHGHIEQWRHGAVA